MAYSLDDWLRCQEVHEQWLLDFVANKPGMYFLMHTKTKKIAWGDPAVDPKNDGQIDAYFRFERLHGFVHGEFFGMVVPKELSEVTKCDWIQTRFNIVGVTVDPADVMKECLRPEGHDGPHLIKRDGGQYVIWEYDLCDFGTCDYCDSDDPDDNCLAYDFVSESEANKLMVSRTRT